MPHNGTSMSPCNREISITVIVSAEVENPLIKHVQLWLVWLQPWKTKLDPNSK